jgi:hypothetical protein
VASDTKTYDPADTNKNGKVSKKEQAAYDESRRAGGGMPATGLDQDRLTKKELRAEYKYTAAQLRVDQGLFDLFQKAFDEQWNKERFDSEVEQLAWYRKNKASVREYLLLKANGGADWEEKRRDTYEAVRQTAMKQGVNLGEEDLWDLTEQSMMNGWGEPGQEYELARALSEKKSQGGVYGGDIAANMDNLKALAAANNVKLDSNWFLSKSKSIASGLALSDDVEREIRQFGAEKSPLFGQKIMAGENLDDLTLPWRKVIADEWELALDQVSLDDPMLQKAIGGFDEQGNPSRMTLGDLQIAARQDPRWLGTQAGKNKSTTVLADMLKMFGMGN